MKYFTCHSDSILINAKSRWILQSVLKTGSILQTQGGKYESHRFTTKTIVFGLIP